MKYPKGDHQLVRFLMGRGSIELYTIKEVFEMLEAKKVGVTHKFLPKAKYDPAGAPLTRHIWSGVWLAYMQGGGGITILWDS